MLNLLDDSLESFLRAAVPLVDVAQGPPHRRPQTGQALSEDVIRCPVMQSGNGRLFAQRTGDEDEGCLGAFL
jgi:hypothetical protein